MSRKMSAAAAILFGVLAAVSFYLYITACAWLLKELLTVAALMLACIGFGLYLGRVCGP